MKKFGLFFNLVTFVSIITLNLTSCVKDEPTVHIIAEIDPNNSYMVNISVQAPDATTLSWDYGDNNFSEEAGNHAYTYAEPGEYTITVTAAGASGTSTNTATIAITPSLVELIAGTSSDGKKWKLSTDHLVTFSAVAIDYAPLYQSMTYQQNALNELGLGDEYDNEFTFYPDGTMKIEGKNGSVLTATVFGLVKQIQPNIGEAGMVANNMYGGEFTNISAGEWEITKETDLPISWTANEFDDLSDGTVTFAEADYITFSNGGFLGIRDFFDKVIIRSISSTEMEIVIFLSTSQQTTANPSLAIKTTFVAQ
jgi:hypothetical protein